MSATKAVNGTWTSRFYYTNYNGERKQAFKRGFKTKKEALEYERDYLAKVEFNVTMTFGKMCELYLEDIVHRIKATSFNLRKGILNNKILPFFSKFEVSEITPAHIRKFQNLLISENNYSQTYLKLINTTLTGVFNYAVNFYKLENNPVTKAGSIGKFTTDMEIWTLDEFNKVSLKLREERIDIYTILNLLFYTGMRIGELLALTFEDIDYEKRVIRVNKTLVRINGIDVSTAPKTEASSRDIQITQNTIDMIKDYSKRIYEINNKMRIFQINQTTIRRQMKIFAKKAGVKEIRVHDLRHSHASLLIHLGVNPLAISKRLGHEKVETTLNIYSHLYPEAGEKIVEMLDKL